MKLFYFLALTVVYAANRVRCEDDQIYVPIGSILYAHGKLDYNRYKLDNITDTFADSGSGRIQLEFNLTFFGHKFDHIYVSNNGHFYFSPKKYRWDYFNFDSFPIPDYPYQWDLPVIAPFYARVDISPRDDKERVYWRTMKRVDGDWPETSVKKRDNDMLWDLENEIHKAIPGADLFRARYGICTTWRNLTTRDHSPDDPAGMNTFQAILVADDNETYAVFNYDKIDWGYNTNTNAKVWARVGFNRGNGTAWKDMGRYSGEPSVVDLANNSNSDAMGRFIARIDGLYDTIKPGGCNNDTEGNASTKGYLDLQIFPRYAGMLGGEQINASGPCFQASDEITCKFDDKLVHGIYEHLQRCRCVVPTLFKVGPVEFSLSIKRNGKILFDFGVWKTQIMIVTPDRVDYKVKLENPRDWVKLPPPKEMWLTMTWDPMAFAQESRSQIEVYLFGYHEDPDNPDPNKRIQFREIRCLGSKAINDGTYTFKPYDRRRDEYKDRYENYWEKRHFEVGTIGITVGGRKNMSLYTPLMPLGWYMYWDLLDDYGDGWNLEKCSIWYNKDIQKSSWRQHLPPCPCKLTQALKDIGRFIADPNCDSRKRGPDGATCQNHEGAHHCVIAVHGSADGGGNQCCYDVEGNLMYTQDRADGSTADRAHTWGTPPYAAPYKVPVLSHVFHDVLPYHYCCTWTDNLMETWYNFKYYYPCRWFLESRNTTGCDRYEPPGPALVYGDPHFRTFNNSFYTFNGKGEYRLLECDNLHFRLHGLFEQPPNNTYGQVNATSLTTITAREGSEGSIVEVRANLPTATWRNRLQIFVDQEEVLLNSSLNRWQWFNNLSIFSETADWNRDNYNLTIMFPSGTGIQVTEAYGTLNVFMAASPYFYRRTEGLFGYWDAREDNDLTVPGPSVDEPIKTITKRDDETVFKDFGKYWLIQSVKLSLLMRPIPVGRNFNMIHLTTNMRDFFPHYGIPPMPINATFSDADVSAFCIDETGNTNLECVYDYRATANKDLAGNTLKQKAWWDNVYEGMKPVNSCGVLPFRGDWEGAVRNPQRYMAGQRIKVTCKSGYNFWGQDSWYCNYDGDWEGETWKDEEDWPMCLTIRHTAQISAYIAAGTVGGLFLILVALACIIAKNKRAPPRKNPFQDDEEDDIHRASSIPSISSSVQGMDNGALQLQEQHISYLAKD